MPNEAASKPNRGEGPIRPGGHHEGFLRCDSNEDTACKHDDRSQPISRRIILILKALTSAGHPTMEPNRSRPGQAESSLRCFSGMRRLMVSNRMRRGNSVRSGGCSESRKRLHSRGGVVRGFDDGLLSRYTESPPEDRGDARTSCEVPAGLVFLRPIQATRPNGPPAPPDVAPEFEPTLARPPRAIRPRSAAGWKP